MLIMYLFWQHIMVLYLNCGVSRKSVMHHCVQFSKKKVLGFQPWVCWSFLWTYLDLFALYILDMSLVLSRRSRAPMCSLLKEISDAIFKPWTGQQFLWTSRSVAHIYILQIFRFKHQCSVLYLNHSVGSNLSCTIVFIFC